jgi:Flp pilus assembly protein TadD
LVRGQQQADPARQALLDALWYTTYPLRGLSVEGSDYDAVDSLIRERNFTGAYIRLERMARTAAPSDTLRYLRAYCLLETGQGEEALRDLDAIRPVPPAWSTQVAWYRGLAYLLAGSDKAALAAFSAITQQPAHPYFEEARKAVDRID